MNYLIVNALVMTVDRERRIIRDGAVATSGDRITDIGKTEELKRRYPDHTLVDARDHIVMPGLINAHVHLTQALIKGCADDVELMDFLQFRVWKLMGSYTPSEAAASARLCILEMLKSGTTTFAETLLAGHYGLDGITDVVVDSGIRGILAKSVMDLPSYATRTAPNANPVSAVVYSANGSDVDDVMVDGKWLVRNGAALTMDEEGILEEARAAIAAVLKKTGVNNDPRWPVS